jgi:hypothetical protein
MKTPRKLLRAAAFAAVLPLLTTAHLWAQYQNQDQDPPSRVARIAWLQGAVSLQPAGLDSWNDAPPNYPMISGDRIYTDQRARAIIQNGSTDIRLWGQTDVTLTNLTDQYEQLGIAQGSIRVRVYALNPGSVVEVDTPNAAVIIQQPGDYRINAYNAQASLVAVNAGSVQITGPGVNQEVDPGDAVQVYGSNPLELGLVEMPAFDDLDRWSIERDHHILNSVSAQYVSRDIPGYDDLDDYGAWAPTPDYGPVWYPRGVAAGWQPYTVGHWAYVSPWGYTWVDDAPWGYAPFHYGRWALIGGRWGWVPGPPAVVPVYSPALVAFVGNPGGASIGVSLGGGVGVAAWFPLGVAEPYVPWYRCTPNYVRTVNVTNINITVIKNVTVVNNYNTFINNTRTVNNVNQIRVTNVNYVNRERVYAVPSNTFSSGGRVQQAAVKLNPQQRQQLAAAPVAIARPPAPQPARPLLQPRPSVARPVVRPALMTPHGVAVATPAANRPNLKPVALPKPQPSAAIRPATKPIAPNLKPSTRPATPAAAPVVAPKPNNQPGTLPPPMPKPAPAGNNSRPVQPPPARPATPPQPPAAQPVRPAPPATNPKPAPQPVTKPVPQPVTQPAARPAAPPPTRPAQTQPPPQPHPAVQPARPAPQPKPAANETKPDDKKQPNDKKSPNDKKAPNYKKQPNDKKQSEDKKPDDKKPE